MPISTPIHSLNSHPPGPVPCAVETGCAIFPHDRFAATTWQVGMSNGFTATLRAWRRRRGLSQMALAARAGISSRHLGFLEVGRAAPSRDMVVRLAAALDIPLRQQNTLLLAAGFAPVWRESRFDAPELAQQEPFPAVAGDRRWNLLQANKGAVRLVEFLVGPLAPGAAVNLADALVAPDVLRPYLTNWEDVVRYFVRTVAADAAMGGTAETATLLDRLLGYRDVRAILKDPLSDAAGPVLPMHFRKGDVALQLFTAIATLGTPQDVTLQELRVESFFPLDEVTAKTFRGWAT